MNIGKLYQVKKYYWLLYPSKDIAKMCLSTLQASWSFTITENDRAYWSNKFNCNVSYLKPNDIFCLLDQDGQYLKMLTSNGEIGWIYLSSVMIGNFYLRK